MIADMESAVAEHEPITELLTLDLARDMFIQSFSFAQGSGELQSFIMQSVHLLRPGWKISDEMYDQIKEDAMPIIKKIVYAAKDPKNKKKKDLHTLWEEHHLITDLNIETQGETALSMMQYLFNEKIGKVPSNDSFFRSLLKSKELQNEYFHNPIPQIVSRSIRLDLAYVSSNGRNFSYFDFFIRNPKADHPLPITVYNQMFAKAHEYFHSTSPENPGAIDYDKLACLDKKLKLVS